MLFASNPHRASFGIAVNEIQRSLGDVPNDAEAAYDLQYTPVRQSWYVGYPVTGGGYQSRNSCSNLGADATTSQSTAETALAQLAKHQRFQAAMQVVGTISILAVATVAVAKAVSESKSKSTVFGRRRRRRK